MSVNLYSFLRKKHKKPFLGALFAVVFLSSFFAFNSTAEAERVSYKRFSCLFEALTGDTCSHSTTEVEVKSGIKSGIAFDKIPSLTEYPAGATVPESNTTHEGIKAIRLKLGLVMDPKKEDTEKNYFWSRIADDTFQKFVVRVSYVIPTGPNQGKTVYWLDRVGAYQYISNTQPLGQEPLFSFYKDSNYSLVSDPAIRNKNVVLTATDSQALPYGSKINADFWYCGGLQDGVSGGDDGRYSPKTGNFDTDRVEYFTTDGKYTYEDDNGNKITATDGIKYDTEMCGGTAAYKIGQTVEITLPSKEGTITSQNTTTAGDTPLPEDQKNAGSTLPVCVLAHPITGSGTFMGCIAYVGYGVYQITAWIAGILGRVMDFFIGYSISDESYRAEVVVTGWKLVRDISNIFFIIILIWTGFATVFNISSISMKKIVPALIINALIINFSLFGTQVVIDISNITARLFYNTMSVCDGKCEYYPPPRDKEIKNPNNRTTGGYKPLSEKIVDSFDPQKIFKPGNLSSSATTTSTGDNKDGKDSASTGFNASGISNNIETSKNLGIYDSDYAIYFLIVSIIAAIIMLAMAKMFFGVMFMFVGRVVGLYMSMIFAPFAVLTRGGMPLVGNIKELSWDNWLKDLTNYALLAPIFVFFLYIIYAFINSDMMSIFKLDANGGFMNTVIEIAIPMIIIYMLIAQGVNIAKKYAGAAGEMLQKYATQATGIVGGAALGVATGGAAFLGTRTAGLMKLSEAKRAELTATKAEGGFAGRMASLRLGMNDKAQSGSFDMRKTKAFSALGSVTSGIGISLNDKVSGAIGLGQDATKGGMKAIEKDEKKKTKEKIESIKTDLKDTEAMEFWKKKSEKMAKKEEERLLANEEDHTTALVAKLMKSGKSEADAKAEVATMKADNTFNDTASKLAQEKINEDYGKVETNKQLTQALRQEFAQTIADGKTFGQQVSAPATALGGIAAGAVAPGAIVAGLSTVGAAPALMTIAYNQNRKNRAEKKNASSYVEDAKKDRKKHKVPKEDRLEEEKKKLETELGEMEEYVESISGTLSEHFDKIIEQANAGNVKYAQFKNRARGSFGADPADTDAAKETQRQDLKNHEQKLRNDSDSLDLDIKSMQDEYIKAEKEGNVAEAKRFKDLKNAYITQKGVLQEKIKMVNADNRNKTVEKLTKVEGELEKIEEKKKKDSEKEDKKEPSK